MCTLPLCKPQVAQVSLQLSSQSPRGHCPLVSVTWLSLTHIRSAACGVCRTLFVLTIPWGLWPALAGLPPTHASNQEVSTLWGGGHTYSLSSVLVLIDRLWQHVSPGC